MNEENKKLDGTIEQDVTDKPTPPKEPPKDDLLPVEIDTLALEESSINLVQSIVDADNVDELKNLTKLFEINQAKKNALRVIKLNNLLDKVNDQAIERFEKRPYEISNKELLDYMKVVGDEIQRSQESIAKIDESPTIQINQQNNSINVNVGENKIDRDSKERVIDAVTQLLKAVRSPIKEEPVVIDITDKGEGK
jgi:hypothetical protein